MIRFDKVTKVFGNGFKAVDELSLEVEKGQCLVLLGTSGSGKTTSMKMVNRLIEPTGGKIEIDGVDVMQQDEIELRRNIGYAIQHIGLFPHMTIGENISVVPKLFKWSDEKISSRTDELLKLVGLGEDFRDRYPKQLSGGQKQRIGVARALAADPPIVLMDEPFGALDPITREQLQDEFLELESQIQKTIIFVTHDIVEAIKMGDKIALMDAGKLQQLAEPADLVENPANEFVENFLGQHRFQLSLITRSIKDVVDKSEQSERVDKDKWYLNLNNNYLQSLDVFKRSGKKELDVFERDRCVGSLKKSELFKAMSEIIN